MSKSNQVNKSNDGGPIPNFSIGLTQLEQEQASDKGKKKGKKMEKRVNKSNDGPIPNFSVGLTQLEQEQASDEDKGKKKGKKMEKKMEKRVKKSKELEPLPSFSIGLTQMEEEGRNEEAKSSDVEDEENAKQRLRHKMSIPKVYDLMNSVNGKQRKDEIINVLNESGFGGMVHIWNWSRVHTFFVDWIVKNFDKENMWITLSKTEVLPLKEEDVHRVYELPMVGKQINLDLCSVEAIKRLRIELGLNGNYSASVRVTDLERILKTQENPKAWVKGAICFIIHKILCPTNSSFVSLQYAHILEDPAGVSSYNWCSHVLEYMKEGLQTPEVANPLADFHFLMINYLEKMGKRSPFLTGKYKRPSLRDWDVKAANQDLQKVHDLMGLEHGLTAGVTRLYNTNEGPHVMCFDADTCPLSKAKMHLDHCRSCIRIYTSAAETLERRIAEGNVGTSVENDAVNGKDPMEVEPEREKGQDQNESFIPQTSTRGGERLNNDKDVADEIDAKTLDESVRKACNIDHSFTQETILKYPEFFDDGGEASNAKESVKPQFEKSNVREVEKPEKFQEFFDGGEASNAGESIKTECEASNVKQANLMSEENPKEHKPLEPNKHCVIEAIPLRSVFPDAIIDLDNVQTVQTKKRKKHDMLYSGGTYPERRRAVKKSKYLASPYDEAIYESNASKMQKDISTFAWSISHDEEELLYCSDNKAHAFSLQRRDLWSLQKDEWVSCFVINAWVDCLNWSQPNAKMTRLVTPFLNYVDLQRPDENHCKRFIERLRNFKYMDWKAIDPTCLEYIMTPALIGDPGFHYACFVVNLKSQKFQFLNSLKGETLNMKNGEATVYKKMFDVWLKEVEAFVIELYRKRKITMPFQFSTFKWETPKMPIQCDKDSCGVFCMKFLAEWDGGNTEMESFKDWSKMRKLGKNGRVAKTMDLRIEICSTILSDSSNSKRTYVEKAATSYYKELLQKLTPD